MRVDGSQGLHLPAHAPDAIAHTVPDAVPHAHAAHTAAVAHDDDDDHDDHDHDDDDDDGPTDAPTDARIVHIQYRNSNWNLRSFNDSSRMHGSRRPTGKNGVKSVQFI
jgi:hypothetical protein